MKLYTFTGAPSPRRVTLYLAEKGMEVEQVEINIRAGEHLNDDFAAISPYCTVPVLELNDGTCLWESVAICRYLEEVRPEPQLMGKTPSERGLVTNWDHWAEVNGLLAVADGFRNRTPRMTDHALPGRRPVAQIEDLAERGRQCYGWFLEDLNKRLGRSDHVAGADFSVADITTLVTIDFARWALKIDPPAGLEHIGRWYAQVNKRPAVESSP